ncbi:Transposon Tf2-6 polyprotein like [Argiope bruennichi]|uniref:RNA-directed DNA polymerase n=1 Tax=Argiope bruennichi TaxID=94029 RepID=A0A8T0EV40_ARGBR|nr:Transposon Tf2-6 polyprotein like [Argiope bruennichi]
MKNPEIPRYVTVDTLPHKEFNSPTKSTTRQSGGKFAPDVNPTGGHDWSERRGRKQDLIKLATELGEEVEGDLKVIELRELILKTSIYKEDLDFVKDTLENIITERLEREERERVADEKERIERDRAYELEKLRLQVESQKLEQTPGLELLPADQQATFNLKKLLPDFDPQDGDMTLFLNLFERQMKILKIVEKLDSYDNLRSVNLKLASKPHETKAIYPKRNQYKSTRFEQRDDRQGLPWIPSQSRRNPGVPSQSRRDPSYKDRPPLSCYGCGEPGVVKAKCAKCNPMVQGDRTQPPTLNHMNFYSILMESQPSSIIEITICGSQAAVCADTGATHSVAGEKLYHFLKNKGLRFENSTVDMALADGHVQKTDILTTTVDIGVAGKVIPTKLIVLKNSKGNRTLLGTDFLRAAGIVLDLQKGLWYFSEAPHQSFNFIEPPADIKSLLAVPVASHPCQLREKEGTHLSGEQRTKFNSLLKRYEKCFQPGGEPTPFIEHRINTGDHLPVAVPPYRMSPTKKETLKQEIDRLLAEGIIEECESPYASPVVLIPKANGTMRLCIDYRKLNSITIPDSYPLPRMDDLLHEAKPTPFMSAIDLKAGYHQVKVHPDDQDKTAFVCPFGTYRFKRMPFGLRNAPATFQRLIDRFRNGLEDIFTLAYLDDIIILSETFEKHLSDLQCVFERLILFKLQANREKCCFASRKVKYLGFWITQKGIEVDPEKIASIQSIPPPQNVKQVQSFLQTCSWFRRYIQNFAEISRPLSDLTKKKSPWNWGFPQQTAFETLKKCLTTPPVLKQANGTKPYIIRTDASHYALGAVLLQGTGSEEHPIEYASRLLTQAERNYSTTEREALAVVWALKKFRGYLEGSEITVASDHQPLRWLLTLKSPTGRLARWALEIQAFNLKVLYVAGKANVVADMLSRPVCDEKETPYEVCNIAIADLPVRSAKDMREAQLADENLKKIIDSFESTQKTEDYANWTERGFLMNQGVLYRYLPDADSEEAQLVIPSSERDSIMEKHHDDPMAGHYGEEGTFQRIAKRYYWTGMRKYINDYVKNCPECNRYKANNQKPAGLLRTPVYSQRFEIISIDLFGPLPKTENGKQWIFIIEDCATRWVELFPLSQATASECAITLIEEIFLRYGIPRRIISDNGSQFVSAVLQQVCCTLNISQNLIPVYFPQSNPVERKNRDLKPRLAILVGDDHGNWHSKLPMIRFAMNTAVCDTTGHTPAFLQFGRELRTVDDVVRDFKAVVENDNFVPEITPYLKRFANIMNELRERIEMKQDRRKIYYDKNRKQVFYSPGDKVWVTSHPISNKFKRKTSKFAPRRDGPYIILTQRSPTTYEIASPSDPSTSLGTYHTSALRSYSRNMEADTPLHPIRKRGRPPKLNSLSSGTNRLPDNSNSVSLPRRRRSQRGRM